WQGKDYLDFLRDGVENSNTLQNTAITKRSVASGVIVTNSRKLVEDCETKFKKWHSLSADLQADHLYEYLYRTKPITDSVCALVALPVLDVLTKFHSEHFLTWCQCKNVDYDHETGHRTASEYSTSVRTTSSNHTTSSPDVRVDRSVCKDQNKGRVDVEKNPGETRTTNATCSAAYDDDRCSPGGYVLSGAECKLYEESQDHKQDLVFFMCCNLRDKSAESVTLGSGRRTPDFHFQRSPPSRTPLSRSPGSSHRARPARQCRSLPQPCLWSPPPWQAPTTQFALGKNNPGLICKAVRYAITLRYFRPPMVEQAALDLESSPERVEPDKQTVSYFWNSDTFDVSLKSENLSGE
ncbi:hypothetical protein J6590_034605, partial [Homalodisca vitripennis]